MVVQAAIKINCQLKLLTSSKEYLLPSIGWEKCFTSFKNIKKSNQKPKTEIIKN